MPDNFDFQNFRIVDVNSVRNFLVQAENAKNRKNYSSVFHLVYALVCALCLYIAMDGIGGIIGAFFLCLAPACCVYNFIYSKVSHNLLATILPLVVFGIKSFVSGASLDTVAIPLFMYLLCIIVAAVLTKVSLSGYTKSTCFILVTVSYLIIILCIIAFLLISATGNCYPKTAIGILDNFFDSAISSTMEFARSDEGITQLQMMLADDPGVSIDQLLEESEKLLVASASVAKSTLPSAIILTCMLFAFVTIEIFSLFAKKLKIDVFVCIMDDFWTYRLSRATTMMYDVVFFAYILGMFINFPSTVNIAVTNLLMIMTPVVFIPGTKSIYGFFRKKKFARTPAIVISAIIVICVIMLTGMLGVYIISSIGVSFVISREIHESMIFPAKFASDSETFLTLYGKDKQQTDTENQNTDNNQQ